MVRKMALSGWRAAACVLAVWVVAASGFGCATTTANSTVPVDRTRLSHEIDWSVNPEGWVDRRHEYTPGGDAGAAEKLAVDEAGWTLGEASFARYPFRGAWRSGEVEVDGGFSDLLPSWNVDAPDRTGLVMDVRVRLAGGAWSEWMEIGRWGDVPYAVGETEFEGGEVAIDVLELDKLADAYEVRARLESRDLDGKASPRLSRVVVLTSTKGATEPVASGTGVRGQRTVIDVPFRAQGVEMPAVSSRICSPTSTSMVMQWAGVDLPTDVNAEGIYDEPYNIFGNWGRAVAWASQHGLRGELRRFRDWGQVRETLEAGQPIIASIRFASGTFPSNVMDATGGHLITLRGITEDGHIIVNDSASRDRGEAIVYARTELAQAWIRNGGVAYIIERGGELAAK
ncbi:MAG: C39 family peptidase [Planctomycetota bacterium]